MLLGSFETLVGLEATRVGQVLELLLGISVHVLRALLGSVDTARLGAVKERLGVCVVLVFPAKACVHAGGLVEQATVVQTLSRQLATSALEHAQRNLLRDVTSLVTIHFILAHVALK